MIKYSINEVQAWIFIIGIFFHGSCYSLLPTSSSNNYILDGSYKDNSGKSKHGFISETTWYAIGVVILVVFGGLISGLTIGLMGLDETNLTVLQRSGSPREKRYATAILPIRKNGYLLLCTLLIANAIISETLPILMDRLVPDPWTAILFSTILILLFAEILPQAFFTKFGLHAGAKLIWLVRIFIAILFPVAYPLSLLIEKLVGKQEGIQYKRNELKELVMMLTGNQLTTEEVMIMTGVLDLIDKRSKHIMIPLDCVYMLDMNSVIDSSLISDIQSKGYSRVPLYLGQRENIVAILLTKALISESVIGKRLSELPLRQVYRVKNTAPLYEILSVLRQGYHGHLAIVMDDKSQLPIGILTLEDIIEELIQQDIIDETDEYTDVATRTRRSSWNWLPSTFLTSKMAHKTTAPMIQNLDSRDEANSSIRLTISTNSDRNSRSGNKSQPTSASPLMETRPLLTSSDVDSSK